MAGVEPRTPDFWPSDIYQTPGPRQAGSTSHPPRRPPVTRAMSSGAAGEAGASMSPARLTSGSEEGGGLPDSGRGSSEGG